MCVSGFSNSYGAGSTARFFIVLNLIHATNQNDHVWVDSWVIEGRYWKNYMFCGQRHRYHNV